MTAKYRYINVKAVSGILNSSGQIAECIARNHIKDILESEQRYVSVEISYDGKTASCSCEEHNKIVCELRDQYRSEYGPHLTEWAKTKTNEMLSDIGLQDVA